MNSLIVTSKKRKNIFLNFLNLTFFIQILLVRNLTNNLDKPKYTLELIILKLRLEGKHHSRAEEMLNKLW